VKDPASQESLNSLKPLLYACSLPEVVEVSGPEAKGEADRRHWAGSAQDSPSAPESPMLSSRVALEAFQGSGEGVSPLSSAMLASRMVSGLGRLGEGRGSRTEKPHCFSGGAGTWGCTWGF